MLRLPWAMATAPMVTLSPATMVPVFSFITTTAATSGSTLVVSMPAMKSTMSPFCWTSAGTATLTSPGSTGLTSVPPRLARIASETRGGGGVVRVEEQDVDVVGSLLLRLAGAASDGRAARNAPDQRVVLTDSVSPAPADLETADRDRRPERGRRPSRPDPPAASAAECRPQDCRHLPARRRSRRGWCPAWRYTGRSAETITAATFLVRTFCCGHRDAHPAKAC